MPDDSFRFESRNDGFSIQAFAWHARDPKAVVVLSHGAAEHALRYERFADALTAAGYAVLAVDHRGHGRSPGPEGLGDFGTGGWDGLVDDIEQLVAIGRERHPGLPLILFGHSMGSAAAQQYILDRSATIDALIMSGTSAREVPHEGEPTPPPPGPNAPFEPARTAYDWLSRDEAEVDKYINDPMCGFESRVSTRNQRADPRRLSDPAALAGIRPDLPMLLVAGDMDPINRNLEGLRLLEARYRAAGVHEIDTRYYAGGRHEMLNETNRDEVTADIVGWLDAFVAGRA